MADKVYLDSSHLAHFTYDATTSQLEVTFHNGRTYTYSEVPADIAGKLRSASSPGKFFHESIRTSFPTKEL